jgi:hypothetical protein
MITNPSTDAVTMGRNPYVKKALFLNRKNAPDPMYVLLDVGPSDDSI